jgi:hypothetical protein
MKKFGTALISGFVMVLFAIIAIIMPAAHGIVGVGGITGASYTMSGYEMIFGNSNDKTSACPGLLVAWIFLLIALLAGVCAIVLLALKKDKKLASFSAAGLIFAFAGLLAFVAGILFFCAIPLYGYESSSVISYKLGAGFVIGGIFSLIAGLGGIAAFVCPILLKK